MSIALDQAINYRSKYAIKVDSKTLAPKKNKGYSKSRKVFRTAVNMLLVFSIMAMAFFGFSGNTQKAQAADVFGVDICEMMSKHGVWFNGSTAPYMGPMNTPKQGKITAYEKYGLSGTTWTVWRGPIDTGKDKPPFEPSGYKNENPYYANGVCVPAPEILTAGTANTMFIFSKVTVFVSGLVYQVAFEGKDTAIKPLQQQIANVINPPDGKPGLKDSLYLEFLVPIIMLSALYLGYVGLVKRRSSEALSSGMWMIGSAVTGLWLLINPMTIPNFTNLAITEVTKGVMTGITSSSADGLQSIGTTKDGQPTGPSALCSVPDENDSSRKITRLVQCSLWYSFIYVPWATGQYGISPTTQSQAERDILNQHAGLMTSGVSLSATGAGNDVTNVNWPLYQLDKQVGNQNQDEAWSKIPMAMLGEPGKQDNNGVVNNAWKGDGSGGLITKAFFSLIASLGAGLMIISLGMSMIVFELGLVILMMLAPLFFLVGVHPGFGRRLALKWVETMLSLTLKRIVLSVLLGVMITFYSIAISIPESQLPWFGTLVLIVAISIAGMKYKDTVTDMFGNINLGGGGPIQEPDSKMGSMAKGALAGATGAAIGTVLAGRAANTASVIRSGKVGADSNKTGTGGAATQRAKVNEALESVNGNGFGGGVPTQDTSASPAVNRAEPKFDNAPATAPIDASDAEAKAAEGAGVVGGAAGAATSDPKRRDIRVQDKQAKAQADATAQRQKLEDRLNKKMSKTSTMARAGSNFKTIGGAAIKGAVMGRSGGDVSFISSTAQSNAMQAKALNQKNTKKGITSASRRQTEYTRAWEEYNAATTEQQKQEASQKIQTAYNQMGKSEKEYLKRVGKVNNRMEGQINKAAGLPKKPAQSEPTQPARSQTSRKVAPTAPSRKHVDPTVKTGGLPTRRPPQSKD